jgi:transcription antitermination factor NusG
MQPESNHWRNDKMDVQSSHLRWCAIQVKPRHEVAVATGLRSRGYTGFLPMYRVKRQWSDRRKEIEVPLFTGYVFCKLDMQIPWSIVSTPGVIRIVGSRKEIAFIDDHEIEAVQIVASSGKKAEPCAYAEIGDRVRITSGALTGLEGIVMGHKNNQRLVLSVNLIQSSISVEVNGCDMTLIGKRPTVAEREMHWSLSQQQPSLEWVGPERYM